MVAAIGPSNLTILKKISVSSFWQCGYRRGGRTKCQPDKMPTGQNANLGWHFVRDFFLWLAFCPDQLFGWHFVRTISRCLGIPPPNLREWGGPVTSFCLLLTVVGKKVDNFLLLGWSGENFAVFDHHHLPWITLPCPHPLAFCC